MTDLSWYAAASAKARLRRVLDDLKRVRVDGAALYSMRLMENIENEVGQIIASLEDDGTLHVYAVRFSNYEPTEIDSLWLDKIEAQKRADEMSAEHADGWHVEPMVVNREWRPGE